MAVIAKTSMQGGSRSPADEYRKGKKVQDKFLRETKGAGKYRGPRGRKKSAQRATAHQQAKERSELTYRETRELMDARSRPMEDISFTEFNEAWQDKMSETELSAAVGKETEYKEEIEKCKVPLHGTLKPGIKALDSLRFMSMNVNCLATWKRYNYKVERLRWASATYRVDMMGLQEVGVNWRSTRTNLSSMLRCGTAPIRSVVSHNKLEMERIGQSQRGGTASIAQDALSKYIKDSGVDHTNLGRWSWFRF